jgi:hypothetical protein
MSPEKVLKELKSWAAKRSRSNRMAGDWHALEEDRRFVMKMHNLSGKGEVKK